MPSEKGKRSQERRLAERYIRHREESAFRELYRAHSPVLFALLLRLSGFDREEAEETLQETWIRACRNLPAFRWESSLRTWLCGIAVTRLRERHRRRQRRPEASLEAVDVPAPWGSATEPAAMDLERAIASLPERYRQVIVLREIQGYTHAEIGRLLDISPGTSKSQLFRARRAVRELMSAQENQDAPEQ